MKTKELTLNALKNMVINNRTMWYGHIFRINKNNHKKGFEHETK
jgi:hypothetical protein